MYKGAPITLSKDLSAETLWARREQNDIFKMLKETSANQEYHIQENYPSKTKEKFRFFQINKC